MYTIEASRITDRAVLVEAIGGIRLAAVFTGEHGLNCTQVPMVVDEAASGGLRLRGHVARANPHWRAIGSGTPAIALFQGPHAYVSPGWYETKRETGKAVPTWAYIAVEARGRLTTIDDPSELRAMLDALTDQNEAGQPAPWTVADAPADYIERMMRGIVGIEMQVEALDGVWKLNQAKSAGDRAGTARGLSEASREEARALARLVPTDPPDR
ncbi:FMN-binding negative transcriptional regulator [Stappia sp. ES.058]|uniref:FMN-binding negative transcriptional regulator n=1 Tax=Stappia sp. ES.058 TaxID=1881061 RepID=UPI00087B4D99|nr:FMN-binding negative transcriptional regulator [Stappia sp. ES.058]SDU27173.1 negative transcriptional regulator, PaiB family [Stappia sp. ES.058]